MSAGKDLMQRNEPQTEIDEAKQVLDEYGMLETILRVEVDDKEAEAKFAEHKTAASVVDVIKDNVQRIRDQGNKKDTRYLTKHIAQALRFITLKKAGKSFLHAVRLTGPHPSFASPPHSLNRPANSLPSNPQWYVFDKLHCNTMQAYTLTVNTRCLAVASSNSRQQPQRRLPHLHHVSNSPVQSVSWVCQSPRPRVWKQCRASSGGNCN